MKVNDEAANGGAKGLRTKRWITHMNDEKRYQQGTKIRRAVLGDEHVDRALASTTEFNRDFQEFITRNAWGDIWERPGLPRHTRSLLTIAMMIALNRGDEFRLHVKAARNNGVTRDEIKEVLLQAAVYCGVPAANSAFHMAAEVFKEMDAAPRKNSPKKQKNKQR
jgi:4-carboxymuconolactone decarboxylase